MDVPGFALITGGASGIGRACAKAFAREGSAGIALIDLSLEALQVVETEIEQQNLSPNKDFRIELYPADVTDEKRINEIVDDMVRKFGRIDYVVNAAGVAIKHKGGAAFAQTDDWNRVLNINLNGTF